MKKKNPYGSLFRPAGAEVLMGGEVRNGCRRVGQKMDLVRLLWNRKVPNDSSLPQFGAVGCPIWGGINADG